MVLIGQKRSRITIQSRTDASDSFGDGAPTWTDLATRWASIVPLSGKEFLQAQAVSASVTHRIFIYHDATTATITPKHRITFGSRVFDILSVLNVRELGRELEIMAVERIGVP